MVREPPVDLCLWKGFVDRGSLIMPLDAHVLKQARKLKLLAKEPATMATARKLTAIMAGVFPGDPLRGDFALFGQGRVGEDAIEHPRLWYTIGQREDLSNALRRGGQGGKQAYERLFRGLRLS
jgi:hypothetical protein